MHPSILALSLLAALAVASAASQPRADAARAAEARALQAQIGQMDTQMRELADQLHQLETAHPEDSGGRDALRQRIHAISGDQQLLEDRLRELRRQGATDPGGAAAPAPIATPAPLPVAAAPVAPAPPPPGPKLREAADPAIYLKAAGDRRSMFFYNAYRWVPVGTRQLAVYNSYDDAVLLDLAADCPGLLSARKIRIENFSTKVYANKSAVLADGQRCLIVGIRDLYTNRLP